MSIELFRATYLEFWGAIESQVVSTSCEMMPYSFKVDTNGFIWSTMEREFTQELLNNINGFANQLNKLSIWLYVIEKHNEEEKFELYYEFTEVSLYYCLHKPTEFKDRLIYCSSHLCHQANLSKVHDYKDKFVKDHIIRKNTLLKVSKYWTNAAELVDSIELIAAQDFVKATGQYRNKSQHRVPPSLIYGHTNLITRTQSEDGEVIYDFGYANPIILKEVLPLLIEEWRKMKKAFKQYWNLVEEQNLLINECGRKKKKS